MRIVGSLWLTMLFTGRLAAVPREALGRGLVAVAVEPGVVFLSWRLLATDAASVNFNLYRTAEGQEAVRLNDAPLSGGTHFVDRTVDPTQTLLSPEGVAANNSTKAAPVLCGENLSDWREEVIWRSADNSELRIYTSTIPTEHRLPTLMHDRQYRLAIAWQNVGYNQPPHPSFYLGEN